MASGQSGGKAPGVLSAGGDQQTVEVNDVVGPIFGQT